jgi:hypothetical protein
MAIVPEELTDMWICGWIGGQAEYDGALCRFQPIEILTKSKPWKDIRSNYAN